MNYQDIVEEKSLRENQEIYVAINFKHLYDKYFQSPINDELFNTLIKN